MLGKKHTHVVIILYLLPLIFFIYRVERKIRWGNKEEGNYALCVYQNMRKGRIRKMVLYKKGENFIHAPNKQFPTQCLKMYLEKYVLEKNLFTGKKHKKKGWSGHKPLDLLQF